MNINLFLNFLIYYIVEVAPALGLGFFLSGLIHEFIPEGFVDRYLAKKNFASLFWAALVGTLLPICCIGQLPVALAFYRRGAKLGPVLAFMVATPATSLTALLVTYRLLGFDFTVYIFFAAILMGLIAGLVGNVMPEPARKQTETACSCCGDECDCAAKQTLVGRVKSVLYYSFVTMPRDMGFEIMVGLVLAALIVSIAPLEKLIALYLGGSFSYLFALVFGLIMYICSTATVPLVHALVTSGMNPGAGMVLLLVGPVTSFGTMLVIRKEFGHKILFAYLAVICVVGLVLGWGFSLI